MNGCWDYGPVPSKSSFFQASQAIARKKEGERETEREEEGKRIEEERRERGGEARGQNKETETQFN